MSKVVVDASFALKWVLPETDSSVAIVLLNKWMTEHTGVLAPALFAYEVTNIIYRQAASGKITYEEARQSLKKLFSIGIALNFSQYEEISANAMKLAQRFKLSATYDAHYIALAQQEKCEFWTADTRLWNVTKDHLSWVHWIGNYHP